MADKKQNFQEQHSGFADAVEDFLMGGLDLVVPHARRDPFNPMAYVKDVNEWFAPSAQMALDEASGEADYPAWAYALASLPVVGKVGKVAGKTAGKVAKESNKKTITMYHNTNFAKAKDIAEGGIKASSDGRGNADKVFTTSSKTAWRNDLRPIQVELEIPKDWYKEHSAYDSRAIENSVTPYGRINEYPFDNFMEKESSPVYIGGRTSVFDEDVPREFIKKICTQDNKCFTPDEWFMLFGGR